MARSWIKTIILLFIIESSGISEQRVLTNVDLLAYAVKGMMDEVMSHLQLDQMTKVFLVKSNSEQNIQRFIVDRFCQGLLERGIEVFSEIESDEEGVILSLIVSKAAVSYNGIYRQSFLKQGWVERKAEVNLSISGVNSKNNQLIWVGEVSGNKMDRIPVSELDFAEQGGLLLGKPKRPKDTGIRKWIDPVLIIGTAGIVVYLFFVIRSR